MGVRSEGEESCGLREMMKKKRHDNHVTCCWRRG